MSIKLCGSWGAWNARKGLQREDIDPIKTWGRDEFGRNSIYHTRALWPEMATGATKPNSCSLLIYAYRWFILKHLGREHWNCIISGVIVKKRSCTYRRWILTPQQFAQKAAEGSIPISHHGGGNALVNHFYLNCSSDTWFSGGGNTSYSFRII